jgi:hypothetical protein
LILRRHRFGFGIENARLAVFGEERGSQAPRDRNHEMESHTV